MAEASQTQIDPLSDRPIYKQIADILRAQIEIGEFGPGDKLPSEAQLQHRFDTARATIRRAVETLVLEGRVRSVRGVGVFVRARPKLRIIQHSNRLQRSHRRDGKGPLDVDAEASGIRIVQHVVAREEVPAPDDVAQRLEIPTGTAVFVRRRRIETEDGTRIQLADSYFPRDVAAGWIREIDTGPGGTYARLEEQRHRLVRFTEELTFRMPTGDETFRLRLDAGTPVIQLIRVAHTKDRVVECFKSVLAGDRHLMQYEIRDDTASGAA